MLVLLLTVLGGMTSGVSAQDGPPRFPVHPERDEIGTQATTPTISVYYNEDWVTGWDWPDGEAVTMTIDNPNNGIGVDFTATETVQLYPGHSDTSVEFHGYGYDIQPGYIVKLTDGATTKTHTVANLQINNVAYSSDTVSGSVTTSSSVVIVGVCLYSSPCLCDSVFIFILTDNCPISRVLIKISYVKLRECFLYVAHKILDAPHFRSAVIDHDNANTHLVESLAPLPIAETVIADDNDISALFYHLKTRRSASCPNSGMRYKPIRFPKHPNAVLT